jgi:uncharacterized damage-inducible protein DinB
MKTFKSKDPQRTGEAQSNAIEIFILNQQRFLELVKQSKSINLTKRVKTTLALIKFKLGDALRFVIYHEVRHVGQAQKAASPE